jgi:hypothetical protein
MQKADHGRLVELLGRLIAFVVGGARVGLLDAIEGYLERRGHIAGPPDGPEGGCRFWWKGVEYQVKGYRLYRLLDYMWHRNQASFGDVEEHVFEGPVSTEAIRSAVCRLNNKVIGGVLRWELTVNTTARLVVKRFFHDPGTD